MDYVSSVTDSSRPLNPVHAKFLPLVEADPTYREMERTYRARPIIWIEYVRRIEQRLLDGWYMDIRERSKDEARVAYELNLLRRHDEAIRGLMIEMAPHFRSSSERVLLGEGGVVVETLDGQVDAFFPRSEAVLEPH